MISSSGKDTSLGCMSEPVHHMCCHSLCVCVCVSLTWYLSFFVCFLLQELPDVNSLPFVDTCNKGPIGVLPYVPHNLYAGHLDPPQMLSIEDIHREIQRCIQMVAHPYTAQPKEFPYFIIESASGSGKTRFALELLQSLRQERDTTAREAAAEFDSSMSNTTTSSTSAAVAGSSAVVHLFPQYFECSTPFQEPVLSVGSNTAAAGRTLLLQLLYDRGGRSISWAAANQLSPNEQETRIVELMHRWSRVRGNSSGGSRVWLLLIDRARIAPHAVSAMLRAIFAWNFPTKGRFFPHSIGIIPIVISTSVVEICVPDILRATGYSPWKEGPLSLPFLSPPKANQLLTNVLAQVGVKETPYVLDLASQFSGWPIAFSFLFTALSRYIISSGSSSSSSIVISKEACHRIYDEVAERIASTYSAEKLIGMSPESVKQVIRIAITGMEVS